MEILNSAAHYITVRFLFVYILVISADSIVGVGPIPQPWLAILVDLGLVWALISWFTKGRKEKHQSRQ